MGGLKKVDQWLLKQLTKYRNEIVSLCRHLEVNKRWTKHKDSLTEASVKVWLDLEEQLNNKLQQIKDKFWELIVPDFEELVQLRILDGVTYIAQKEGREADLTDLLTYNSFQQVNHLGLGLKRQRS